MNNDNLEKIIESAKNINLSHEEKLQIKSSLISHIQNTPINKPVKSPFYSLGTFLTFRSLYALPIAVLLFVFLGGGTTYYAAQGTIPGDKLYSVKLGLNENVDALLAVSSEAKAELDLKQLSERLDEAEKLNSAGSLDEVTSEVIQQSLSKKVESLNKNISKVRQKGNTEKAEKVFENFEKEIDDHFDTFLTITNSASNSPVFASIISSRNSKVGTATFMTTSVKSSKSSKKIEDSKKVEKRDDGDDDEDEDEDEDDDHGGLKTIQPVTPVTTATTTTTTATTVTSYSLSDVSKHNKDTDCWTVVSGGVYNLTAWIATHPGGESAIISMCGIDATQDFNAQHKGQSKPESKLAAFKIGILK